VAKKRKQHQDKTERPQHMSDNHNFLHRKPLNDAVQPARHSHFEYMYL
jgi:hypothetical protein